MSVIIPENQLPQELSAEAAVEAAYAGTLSEIASDLVRGLPVLVECDKDLMPFLFMNVRSRLRPHQLRCLFLDGRTPPEGQQMPQGLIATMIGQLRDAVRGAVEKRVVVLPHLDLLATSQGALTTEAKEVIALLYENPELVWLGFKDPSFPLPRVIENLFPHRVSLLGIPRNRLSQLVTQKESRKFGRQFNPWALYKYVSGMNAVRLRKLLSTLEGEDYPESPARAYAQIRQATSGGKLEIPSVDLETQLGGYDKVKKRLRSEILDVLTRKDECSNAEEISRLEGLIPRGMIFWGPPGTGKTLFAKAMATAIGAAITIVSGPELKSRWVGESEENLRQIFHKARQSAPAIIVFDELDSFAAARGTYTGSGVEHSMVNQLLTEMDGFSSDELVFVVGTTNFVEILDPALLRPGRFEFHLHIPYPDKDDRRAILKIYNASMKLEMTDDALDFAVRRTGDYVEGASAGTRFSGDHLNALCRALARIRLREDRSGPTTEADIDRALTEWVERPNMTPAEEKVVATHEAGHAVVSLFCKHATPIERISIRGDSAGALGFVQYQDPAHRYVVTRGQMLDDLCILMGGREAEQLLLEDISIGSAGDLDRATEIARALVENFGMGGPEVGVVSYASENPRSDGRRSCLSASQLELLDKAVARLLLEAKERAAQILLEHRAIVELLRDELVVKKSLDAKAISSFLSNRESQ
ncbi:MAG: AAA family ATPase [Planctomycetaceae bacterium]|nr:AAA family ATPase [Planctomycetaceae bacterium]